MKGKSWAHGRAAGVGILIALFGATAEGQAASTRERSPTPGTRSYVNAVVVATDARAGTITLRGGAIGDGQTFPVAPEAREGVGALNPGEPVVLTLRAAAPGRNVVIHIERSVAGAAGTRPRPAGAPVAPGPRVSSGAASTTTRPAPSVSPSAAATPAPRAEPPRLPTDTVGPLRDPRVDPNFDPRQNPLRNPDVVPGLSEPAPAPTPTPPPSAAR